MVRPLSLIITYAMGINVFLYCLELFTAFYSGIPGHADPIVFLFMGHEGVDAWVERLDVDGRGIRLCLADPADYAAFPHKRQDPPLGADHAVHRHMDRQESGTSYSAALPRLRNETIEIYTPSFWEISVGLGIFAWGR